ncbi:UDP-N-acetylmuramoyl-tripeptide--D-alanyl-D-alanine ligase [Chlamydiifrater phoenicopteri]|uniref:UDP-N-acetylmuramoyl-tripeptide--D-alanyl-D- alanine ligase n=1 Tax=Chlamydiifrater phoenicopteri TaxID=2681469 RepID=UPI001BCBBF9D|nr:UDP-N-acetylmuramoyl-tripeptide--D-alanyl-D-alanine ligase [Chlamydiifrater phoenicopteri]
MRPILLSEWVSLLFPDVPEIRSSKMVSGVVIDSRQVQAGDVFFALPGARVDGHSFLQEASQKGAVAAVVSSEYSGGDFGLELIRVPSVSEALSSAGNCKYNLYEGVVVGITGSLGKTTVKVFLNAILSSAYTVFSTPKSYNTQLTVPLSLLMSGGDEDFLILEMGVSSPGDMSNLLKVVEPDVAVVTQVSSQHTAFFSDGKQGICQEKTRIFGVNKAQIQLLPRDSEFFDFMKNVNPMAEQFSFSFSNFLADFHYKSISDSGVMIATPFGDLSLNIKFPYKPAYINFLIAVSLATILGISPEEIESVLPNIKLPPMRFESMESNGITVINDAYNASPEAVLAALESLPEPGPQGKTVLVLGHMAELGAYSNEGHAIVAEVALKKAQAIFFIGDKWEPVQWMCKQSPCNVEFHPTPNSLVEKLKKLVCKGDVVLLKGSRIFALESLLSCF